MADLVVANVYTRFISDENWEGIDTEVPDFEEPAMTIDTPKEIIEVVKNILLKAISNQNEPHLSLAFNHDGELKTNAVLRVKTHQDDPNSIDMYLAEVVSETDAIRAFNVLVSKCACCDDLNVTMNPNVDEYVAPIEALDEYLDRIYVLAVSWGELVKEAENRNIQ